MAPKSNSARQSFAVWCGIEIVAATSPCAISGAAAPRAIEHVERRRMKGRGAQLLTQRGAGLDDGDRDAVFDQVGGRHQADRPGARNEDAIS